MSTKFSGQSDQNNTGSYKVENNKVVITDPNVSDTESAFELNIVGNELVVNEADMDGGNSNTACGDGYYFVYVFGKV